MYIVPCVPRPILACAWVCSMKQCSCGQRHRTSSPRFPFPPYHPLAAAWYSTSLALVNRCPKQWAESSHTLVQNLSECPYLAVISGQEATRDKDLPCFSNPLHSSKPTTENFAWNRMTTNLPNRGMLACGGGNGSSSGINTNDSTAAASDLIINSRGRMAVIRTSAPSVGSEPATATTPSIVVSPRSSPNPVCCDSLVMGAALNIQASASGGNDRLLSSLGHARRVGSSTSSMWNGYTDSVTPESPQPIQLDRLPRVSSFAVAPTVAVNDAGGSDTPAASGTPMLPPVNFSASATGTPNLTVSAMNGNGDGPLPDGAFLPSLLSVVAHYFLVDQLQVIPTPLDIPGQVQKKYEHRSSSLASNDRVHTGPDTMVLVLTRFSMGRLLRSEKGSVEAEAVLLEWIKGELLAGSSMQLKKGRPNNMEERPFSYTSRRQQKSRVNNDIFSRNEDLLSDLPTAVEQSSSTQCFGSAYNIKSYSRGPPLSSSPKYMSAAERRELRYRSGRLAR